MTTTAVVLAAGQGRRMRSALPKVLHPIAGRPMIAHVLDAVSGADMDAIVVHGYGGDTLRQVGADWPVRWAEQAEQLGTGHAVQQAMPLLEGTARVLVLYGDVPLIRAETLTRLAATRDEVCLLTVRLADPTGYGRIVRSGAGDVMRIVEEKDASEAQRRIDEVNTGMLVADVAPLAGWLAALGNDNAQGEYYLTDVVELAVADGHRVTALEATDAYEVLGVNDRHQLAAAEHGFRLRQARAAMDAGATLVDPARTDIRGRLTVGADVRIDVNCVFEGDVELAANVCVGPHCVLKNVRVQAETEIHAFSHLEYAEIGAACSVGPYARIRPGTRLEDKAKVGNFVEVKKSTLGAGSKVNHLSYIGDTEMGADVNVGAGTITCNYDGANKHRTVIGDRVFIGSDTQLVAPVQVGDDATIGAGTTVTRDVEPGKLAVGRARQTSIDGWRRPTKK